MVIREHSHSDFCVGGTYSDHSTIAKFLEEDFNLLRVVTLRDPIDSYISLVKNGWVHFQPQSFDEYCHRVWSFLSEYEDKSIFKYEDFVKDPINEMKQITKVLRLSFDESFIDTFSIFKVTGDSGRSGNIIGERERRKLSEAEIVEFSSSKFYSLIASRFNYTTLENYK